MFIELLEFIDRAFFASLTKENRGPRIITIALNNGELLKLHVRHRKLLDKLEHELLPNKVHILDRNSVESLVSSSNSEEVVKTFTTIESVEDAIRQMRRENDFDVTAIFATFETEIEQRQVLKELSAGWLYDYGILNPPRSQPRFRKKLVLMVKEPNEPSSIHWVDLGISVWEFMGRMVLSNLIVIAIIGLCAIIIDILRRESYVAVVIALLNQIFPHICKFINASEKHFNETSSQLSLYIKITLFRWINTAVLITTITPFTSTLSIGENNLLKTVVNIFFAELVIAPTFRLLDIPNTIKKHIIAPRLKSQIGMIRMFRGTQVKMAERYTEATKVVFLCFYYSALLPKGFFIGSFALCVYYLIDKFCLLRTWGQAPRIDKDICQFQRRYFLWIALIFLGVMASYCYSGFPYDGLCKSKYDESGVVYEYCNQDMLGSFQFPPFPSKQLSLGHEWMTEKQKDVVTYYCYIAVAVLVLGVTASIGRSFWEFMRAAFVDSYTEVGGAQATPYSAIPSIYAYVPEVPVPGFMFPLIACDLKEINVENIYWRNPNLPHSHYSIVDDVADNHENVDYPAKTSGMNYSLVKYFDLSSE